MNRVDYLIPTSHMVLPREAEQILDHTIGGGEDLLKFGVDDFSEIMSWVNLADLALEFVPSCRESLHTCFDWYGTNRERVEVSLSILRDARSKVYNPLQFGLYEPSTAYQMLMDRVCNGRKPQCTPHHPARLLSLSRTRSISEETNESKNFQEHT